MRVLMLNYEFPPIGGGAANANHNLLSEFAERDDIEVDLVTSSPDDYREKSFAENVTLYKLDVGKIDRHYWRVAEIGRWSAKAYLKVRSLVRRREYDLCHSWFGWPCGYIAHRFRDSVPYLVALRGSDIPGYNPRLERLDDFVFEPLSRTVWGEAQYVTVLSSDSERMARRTLDRNFTTIPNGVNTDKFRPSQSVQMEPPLNLLYVGRLIPRKGIEYLLDGMATVIADRPDSPVRLSIVGSGNVQAELERTVTKLDLHEFVTFEGSKPHDSLPEIYRNADVFVLPSTNEALSNVVLEAIASGLAVVSTDTGAAELVDGNGLVVKRRDSKAIADAIRKYVDDPHLVDRHKRRSRDVRSNLSWGCFADRYLELYRSMTDRPVRHVSA